MILAAPLLRHRSRLLAAGLLLAALTGGCGGGVSIGFGFGDVFGDGRAPDVSLAVSPAVTTPGAIVELVAVASDADGIEQVAFYRVENGGPLLLHAVGQRPYRFETPTPTDGRSSVRYFAQATDRSGRRSDSAVQAVTLRP